MCCSAVFVADRSTQMHGHQYFFGSKQCNCRIKALFSLKITEIGFVGCNPVQGRLQMSRTPDQSSIAAVHPKQKQGHSMVMMHDLCRIRGLSRATLVQQPSSHRASPTSSVHRAASAVQKSSSPSRRALPCRILAFNLPPSPWPIATSNTIVARPAPRSPGRAGCAARTGRETP